MLVAVLLFVVYVEGVMFIAMWLLYDVLYLVSCPPILCLAARVEVACVLSIAPAYGWWLISQWELV